MTRVRVHQHVNPLAKHFRRLEIKPLILEEIFDDPTRPLNLDIGSARGRFLLGMAEHDPDTNFLGVEIRAPLVDEAMRIKEERGLQNLHYEFCNATIDLDALLESIPNDLLFLAMIQFPDPWFKRKHAKRRMVKSNLVDILDEKLIKDGRIFIQTDVEFLADEIVKLFTTGKAFASDRIELNPLPIRTEREKSVENRNLPVFRYLLKRKKSR